MSVVVNCVWVHWVDLDISERLANKYNANRRPPQGVMTEAVRLALSRP